MPFNWPKEIVVAQLVKQRVMELDVNGVWPHHLPEVAARGEELEAAEETLGHALDSRYRDFLLHANGWQGFMQAVDLFGTGDLVGGGRRDRALRLLRTLEPLKEICGFDGEDLLPIAVSRNDIDLFVSVRPGRDGAGSVLWFAGQVIDTFPNFDEYFLAMVDYCRHEALRLQTPPDARR